MTHLWSAHRLPKQQIHRQPFRAMHFIFRRALWMRPTVAFRVSPHRIAVPHPLLTLQKARIPREEWQASHYVWCPRKALWLQPHVTVFWRWCSNRSRPLNASSVPSAPGTLLPQIPHLPLTNFALSVTWKLLHHDGGGVDQRFVSGKADDKLPFFCFIHRNWTDQQEKKAHEFFEDWSKQSKFYKKEKDPLVWVFERGFSWVLIPSRSC